MRISEQSKNRRWNGVVGKGLERALIWMTHEMRIIEKEENVHSHESNRLWSLFTRLDAAQRIHGISRRATLHFEPHAYCVWVSVRAWFVTKCDQNLCCCYTFTISFGSQLCFFFMCSFHTMHVRRFAYDFIYQIYRFIFVILLCLSCCCCCCCFISLLLFFLFILFICMVARISCG